MPLPPPRVTTRTMPTLHRDSTRRRRWTGLAFSPTCSGSVDQELLSRNEYLVTENRILKGQLKGRLHIESARRHGRRLSVPTRPCSQGPDFFTVEVFTLRGLVIFYVLFSSIWRAVA